MSINELQYQARPQRNDNAGSSGRSCEDVPTGPYCTWHERINQHDICCETHHARLCQRGKWLTIKATCPNRALTMLNGRDNPGVFSPVRRTDKTIHTTSGNTRHVWPLHLPRNLDIHTTCTLRSKVLGHANAISRPLEWPRSHSISHADGCELGAVDISLIFLLYHHLCMETLARSLHKEEKAQSKERERTKKGKGQQWGEKPNKSEGKWAKNQFRKGERRNKKMVVTQDFIICSFHKQSALKVLKRLTSSHLILPRLSDDEEAQRRNN